MPILFGVLLVYGFYISGKDIFGRWAYGSLLITNKMKFICEPKGFIDTEKTYIKDEETIGQFTGLYDKNKVPIYEGDIVRKELFSDIKLDNRAYEYAKVMWIEELAEYHLVNRKGKTLWTIGDEKYNIEVIGNIYENSDLLGE